jgi:hypothetical protein
MTSTYNEWLPWHRITMDGNHNIKLQSMVTITSTYNGRLP